MTRALRTFPAPTPPPDPVTPQATLTAAVLAWRLETVAKALNISRRTLERERSAGRFPQPDLRIGRAPLWRPETIAAWVNAGGAK